MAELLEFHSLAPLNKSTMLVFAMTHAEADSTELGLFAGRFALLENSSVELYALIPLMDALSQSS
jgi:hypothetical protein